jgi:hypothetical protein
MSLSLKREEKLILRISLMLANLKRECNRGIFQETADREGFEMNKSEINRLGRGCRSKGEGLGINKSKVGIQGELHIRREEELWMRL